MKKKAEISKKRRGPPPTGKGAPVLVRMQPDELRALDAFIAKAPGPQRSRPEAVRLLVAAALAAGVKTISVDPSKAALARSDAKQIDRLENEGGETDAPTRSSRRQAKGVARAKELAVGAVKAALGRVAAPIEEKIARGRKLVKRPPGLEPN